MSLTPGNHSFTIYQGATFYKRIIYQVDGVIQDLTSYSAQLVIKDEPEGDTLLTLTDGHGITLGTTDGTIDLLIDAAVTADLTWTNAAYELFVTDNSDRTDVLLRGGFKVVRF